MSIDLRLRYRNYKALAELKWHETSLRPAKTRARAERRTLAKYARAGVWNGPHPRAGKSARAALVGAVALAGSAVYCRLWKVCGPRSQRPRLRGFKRWQYQLPREGRASGHARAVAAAEKRTASADGADGASKRRRVTNGSDCSASGEEAHDSDASAASAPRDSEASSSEC